MATFDQDRDFPVLRNGQELRSLFRRASPFVDAKPRSVSFELAAVATQLGRFDALADRAGDEEAAAREVVGALRLRAGSPDDVPSLIILPNGWIAMPRAPSGADGMPLRAAIYGDESDTVRENVLAAACAVLLGLNDLFDGDDDPPGPDDPPLVAPQDWDPAVSRLIGRAELLKAYREHRRAEADSQPSAPRAGRNILAAPLQWLVAERDRAARAAPQAPAAVRGRGPAADVDLHDHVVNLSFGTLVDSGQFETRPEDVAAIVGKAIGFLGGDPSRRLVVYAHGGLVGERRGLAYAQATAGWWLENGVYPIFCVWESDAFTTIRGLIGQMFTRQRGLGFDELRDAAIESLVHHLGVPVWDAMKQSATRASSPGGGLELLALTLAEEIGKARALPRSDARHLPKAPDVHLVGHSAGAILHLHFLACLKSAGLSVGSVQFLAPAATADLARAALAQHGSIGRCRLYAMDDAAERADPTSAPYGKSLLYLVRGGFERVAGTPILGLQKDLRADRALVEVIAGGQSTRECLVFSPTPAGTAARLASHSVTHGGFDNDRSTMESVIWLIRDAGPPTPFPEAAVADRAARAADDDAALPEAVLSYLALTARATAAPGPAVARPGDSGQPPVWAEPRSAVSRLLSIGIDNYAAGKRLAGCENDSRRWRQRLSARAGWDVVPTENATWTRQAIVDELGRFVATGRSGDLLVWHYSGHGMEVASDDPASEPNAADQAIVGSNADQADTALARHALVDDDLYDILQRVADGVRLYVFFDCCYSGTATRFYTPGTPRTLGKIRVRGYRPRQRPIVGRSVDDNAAYAAARHVLFSACSPVQVAAEDGPGEIQGAFTRAMWELLDTTPAGLTNRSFCDRVRATLSARGNDQLPGVYGPESRRDDPFPL